MWIILGLLLSLPLMALESFEVLPNVKILKFLPDNVVVMNRGLEDGIQRNDHAKLSSDVLGFSSRALCLKVTKDLSYWKLYRVPQKEAFSLDYTYTISGIADREIPSNIAKLRYEIQRFPDLHEKKESSTGPDPFLIKPDLPERLTERDLLESVGTEKRKLFVEEVFDRERMKKDLSDYNLSLYASPFTRQSINQGESLRYGLRGENKASKYRLLTQFEQQQTKIQDPITKESVSTRSTSGQAQFVIHELSPSFSFLSLLNYNSQRFSELATPKSHWQFGPIGFTWHIFQSKNWEYFDLSYVPLYDLRKTEVLRNGAIKEDDTRGIRHGVRLGFKTKLNDRAALENLLWVRPFQDMASWRLESDNLNLVNDLKLIFSVSDKLFIDYNIVYQKDKLWNTLSNLPESNTINSINLRYDFSI
jgi:hypothetical protein